MMLFWHEAQQIDDAKVRTAFTKLSGELLPPRNVTDAEALVECGDPIIPYLAMNEKWSDQQRAACVRALGMIGGPRTIRLLRDYGRDTTSTVGFELFRLVTNSPQLFMAIGQSLTSLNLSSKNVTDLASLARLSSLQSLDLRGTGVTNVSALVSLKKQGLKISD